MQVYKWMKGSKMGDVSKVLVAREQSRTCSNGFRLDKCRLKKVIVKKWDANSLADERNKLYSHMLSAYAIGIFMKKRIIEFPQGSLLTS